MSANLIERSTRLHALDLEYQQNRHKTELISRDEEARRLQLRVLMLRDENSRLQDRCAAKDAEIKALTRDGNQLRIELDGIKDEKRPNDAETEDVAIEDASSAAETSSCETHMQDLSRALDENIALTKELQQLRPEIELLRQQVTNYEKMLAEQRAKELASKRQPKAGNLNDEGEDIAELRAALDRVTEKLAQEEKQRESTKSSHKKAQEESERQNEKLEQRIAALQKKLKDAQKELRDVRKELKVPQSRLKGDGLEDEDTTHSQETTAKPRARGQSPTAQNERLARRNKRATERAMVGEKSTFSVTPLLNKTKEATQNTAKEANGLALTLDDVLAQDQGDDASPLVVANKSDNQPTMAPNVEQDIYTPLRPRETLRSRKKAAAAGSATPDESHMANLTASIQNIGRANAEDANDEGVSKTVDSKETAPSKRIKLHETAVADPASAVEQKKRKRKLLNTTNDIILEEDETGEGVQPLEAPLGRARRMKTSATSAFNSQTGKKPFSPLKRHKRGVNASFLV